MVPLIGQIGAHAGQFEELAHGAARVCWKVGEKLQLTLTANFSQETLAGVLSLEGHTLWIEGSLLDGNRMGPWSLRWALEEVP